MQDMSTHRYCIHTYLFSSTKNTDEFYFGLLNWFIEQYGRVQSRIIDSFHISAKTHSSWHRKNGRGHLCWYTWCEVNCKNKRTVLHYGVCFRVISIRSLNIATGYISGRYLQKKQDHQTFSNGSINCWSIIAKKINRQILEFQQSDTVHLYWHILPVILETWYARPQMSQLSAIYILL